MTHVWIDPSLPVAGELLRAASERAWDGAAPAGGVPDLVIAAWPPRPEVEAWIVAGARVLAVVSGDLGVVAALRAGCRAVADSRWGTAAILAEAQALLGVSDSIAGRDSGPLAGLLSESEFLEQIASAIEAAARADQLVAVLALDTRRVRRLASSNLSRDAGDSLIAAIVARLREGLRDSDAVVRVERGPRGPSIARVSGEQLALVLDGLRTPQDAARVASRLVEQLARPFDVDGCEMCVPSIIGIATYPAEGSEPRQLLERAETAAYCARQDGHGLFKFYSSQLDARAFERLTLEGSMRRGLERDEFVVYYQPKVEIRTGRVTGFEALVRWKHPDLGMVSPAQFIPLAEETGLIVPLGEHVLRQACRQNKEWQRQGLAPVRMAVNLSSIQFQQPQLAGVIRRVLDETGLDAPWLELELTESLLMQNSHGAIETLKRLRSAGVHLSIDDFGTGYSSLAYLKRFPIQALKIDQSFIRESTSSPDDAAIVTSIILMARSLKMSTIAEGVETNAQLAFLRVLNCEEAQGYLFSPPVPAAQAGEILRRDFSADIAA
ncbi:MAG: bifunctional diguanylate cyclase/phosphodiesterase [Planctomycetes bacterium]|nr:bifunctional diguanylate cyclase/phosphodiesterase [Planctomycetota bacterium]